MWHRWGYNSYKSTGNVNYISQQYHAKSTYSCLYDENFSKQYIDAIIKNNKIGSNSICLDNVNVPTSENNNINIRLNK